MSTSGTTTPSPDPRPVRFGVIGAGFIANWFAQAVDAIPDARIVGVTSARPERAAAFAAEHKVPASWASLEEMLAAQGENAVDAVYVGSPNHLHAEHTIAALRAGRHVLVEKPFAVTPAQARDMAAEALRADRLLVEGWLPAFEPGTAVIRENLARLGEIRRAVFVKEQYSSRMDAYKAGSLPGAFDPAMAGGSLMDLGIYPVSMAIHLFGIPDRVTATGVLLDSGVDAMGTIVLGYDDGPEVVCMHSKASSTGLDCQVAGEHHVLVMDDCQWPRRITLHGPRQRTGGANPQAPEDLSVERTGPAQVYELAAFCELVRSGARECGLHPVESSVTAIEVLSQARRQVGVRFPADDDAPQP